ncbi:MAG: beta strand repeat-containing protein, partial [Candidatus Spyradenecus sp.]
MYTRDMELLGSDGFIEATKVGTNGSKTYSFSGLTEGQEVLIFVTGGLESGTSRDSNTSNGSITLTGADHKALSGCPAYWTSWDKLNITSTSPNNSYYYFPITVNSDATSATMTYTWSAGTKQINLKRVDAFDISTRVPKLLFSDEHDGQAGTATSNNSYTVDSLPAGGKVLLRLQANTQATGGNHIGGFTLSGATTLADLTQVVAGGTSAPVYSAAAGDTLTVTGTIAGDVPVTVGAEGQTGTVTFAAGTLANYTGTIALGNATLTFADLTERPAIQVTNDAAIIDLTSVESLLTGKISLAGITFADGVTQCTVKGGDVTATVTATELTAGSVSVTAVPTYAGNRWWWDYEFNGNGNNSGFEGTNLSWDTDRPFKDSEYTTADENGNQMLHLPARPWRNVGSGYPESFTAVMYCKAGSAANSILAAFGSSYNNGTEAIVLMTGANPAAGQMSLVLCHAKTSFDTLVDQEKMTVPNVSSSYHLYAFTCRTVEEKTVVDIYVDGELVTSYKADSLITLGQGFQLASEHGGSPSGVNRLADADAATLDFLRVSNVALSAEAIKAMAAAYPYTSPNGRATRTVTASDTTWSEGTTWAQATLQEDGTTATVNQAAPTADTVVEVTASEAATLAMNLADAVTYEILVVKGEGSLKVTKAADTTATVTISGTTTISANTTLPANVVKVGRVSVDADKTLTFDCSTLDGVQSSYVLTGYVEEAVASRIAVANVPASALYSDYTLSRDNTGSMVLTASTLKPIAATISGENSWADVLWTWEGNSTGSTLAAIPDGANVTLTLSADSTLTLPASAITVADLTISGTGTLTFAETGATVTVTNTLTANTDVDASTGKLILASTVTNVAIADDKTIQYKTTADTTLPPMSGTNGTFSVNCAATTKLSHTVDYLSAIVVSGGTLDFTAENYTKPFKMTVQNGAMARTDWAGALTSTAASLRLEGGATFFMRNGNTTNGNSQIVTPITIAATNELPAVIKGSHNGNNLHLTGTISGTGTLKFAGFNNHFTVEGVISDGSNEGDVLAVVLDSIASGENSAANVIFTADNTYTGGTTIKTGANLTLNGTTVDTKPLPDCSYDSTEKTYSSKTTVETDAKVQLLNGMSYAYIEGQGTVEVTGDFIFGQGNNQSGIAVPVTVAAGKTFAIRNFRDGEAFNLSSLTLNASSTVKQDTFSNDWTKSASLSITKTLAGTGTINLPLTFESGATLDVSAGPLTVTKDVTCNGTVTVTLPEDAAEGTTILNCSNPDDVVGKLTATSMQEGLQFSATDAAVVLAAVPTIEIPKVDEVELAEASQAVLAAAAQAAGLDTVTAVTGSTSVAGETKTLTAEQIDNVLAVFGASVVTADTTNKTLKVDYNFGIVAIEPNYLNGVLSTFTVKVAIETADGTLASLTEDATIVLVDSDSGATISDG